LLWKIEHTDVVLTREYEIIIQLISTLLAQYNELRERWINTTIHGTLGLPTCRDNVKQFNEMKAREEKIKQEALAHEKSVPAPRLQRVEVVDGTGTRHRSGVKWQGTKLVSFSSSEDIYNSGGNEWLRITMVLSYQCGKLHAADAAEPDPRATVV